MANKFFVGRQDEISLLNKYYKSNKPEFVAVYGRRRVGKTYLIKETLKDKFDFEFTGMYKVPAKEQRQLFQNNLNTLSRENNLNPKDWFEAFSNLKTYLVSLNKKIVTVFLDELPWMDTSKSNFLPALSLSVNIDNLFFSKNAPLKTEYDFLFRSLFKDSNNYRKVVELLSTKLIGLTREEISDGINLSGGELTTILKNLSTCDFIREYYDPQKKNRAKSYQLTDMFSLFYLRFVQRGSGQDEHFWTNLGQSGKKNARLGYAFEQICLHHIHQIKAKLGISGILSNVYAWHQSPYIDKDGNEWTGGQIDLIIDRSDNVMNLCEMKYSSDKYAIDKNYAETLRSRTELFRRSLKNRKDLRLTFITPYGVKSNKYSSIIDHQIAMTDLFL